MAEDNDDQNLLTQQIFYKNRCPYPVLAKSIAEYNFNLEEITDFMQIACSFQEKKSIQPENVLFAKNNSLQSVENEKAVIRVEKQKFIEFVVNTQKHRIPKQLLEKKFKRVKIKENGMIEVFQESFTNSKKKDAKINKKQQELSKLFEYTIKQLKEKENLANQQQVKEDDQVSEANVDEEGFDDMSEQQQDNGGMDFEDDEYNKNQSGNGSEGEF